MTLLRGYLLLLSLFGTSALAADSGREAERKAILEEMLVDPGDPAGEESMFAAPLMDRIVGQLSSDPGWMDQIYRSDEIEISGALVMGIYAHLLRTDPPLFIRVIDKTSFDLPVDFSEGVIFRGPSQEQPLSFASAILSAAARVKDSPNFTATLAMLAKEPATAAALLQLMLDGRTVPEPLARDAARAAGTGNVPLPEKIDQLPAGIRSIVKAEREKRDREQSGFRAALAFLDGKATEEVFLDPSLDSSAAAIRLAWGGVLAPEVLLARLNGEDLRSVAKVFATIGGSITSLSCCSAPHPFLARQIPMPSLPRFCAAVPAASFRSASPWLAG